MDDTPPSDLAGTRPLIVYRKEPNHIVVMARGHAPINLRPGDQLVFTYTVTEALELQQVPEMPAADG
jgi:hypothetical protein